MLESLSAETLVRWNPETNGWRLVRDHAEASHFYTEQGARTIIVLTREPWTLYRCDCAAPSALGRPHPAAGG